MQLYRHFALSHPYTHGQYTNPGGDRHAFVQGILLCHTPTHAWSVLDPWRIQTCNCADILLCHTPPHGHLVRKICIVHMISDLALFTGLCVGTLMVHRCVHNQQSSLKISVHHRIINDRIEKYGANIVFISK